MARLKKYLEQNNFTLIVSLPANDASMAQAAIEEGADGLKVHMNVSHRASETIFGPMEQYETVFRKIRALCAGPLGIVPTGRLEEAQQEHMRKLAAMDFDFYSIYAHHLPSFMMAEKALDRTFAINEQYDLSLVDGVGTFGFAALEASIIPGTEYGQPLSFADVLKYRKLAKLAGIPVIVPSQRKLVSADLQALKDAGVKAVLLGAVVLGNTEQHIRQRVADFRNAIDRLT